MADRILLINAETDGVFCRQWTWYDLGKGTPYKFLTLPWGIQANRVKAEIAKRRQAGRGKGG